MLLSDNPVNGIVYIILGFVVQFLSRLMVIDVMTAVKVGDCSC